VVVVCFASSGWLAFYMNGEWISLFGVAFGSRPSSFIEPVLTKRIEQIPHVREPGGDELSLVTRTQSLKRKIYQQESTSSRGNQSSTHGSDYSCTSTPATGIVDKLEGGVFRWSDDQGGVHFSDVAPKNFEATTLLGQATPDFFNLIVTYPSGYVPSDISNIVSVGGRAIYQVYSTYLQKENMSKSNIDVRVYGNESAYQSFKKKIAPSVTAEIPGFYSWGANVAVVLHKNSVDRTNETALHEATHVINAKNFGKMPKWFNEGMAVVFERAAVAGQAITISPSAYSIEFLRTKATPLSLVQLLGSAHAQWDGDMRPTYYANAWSLAYFLMQPGNRALMTAFQRAMAMNKCDEMDSVAYFEANYSGGLRGLDNAWRAWRHRESIPVISF
jgi:hypothetical protein